MESDYYRNVLYDQMNPMPVTIEPDLENPRPTVTADIEAGRIVEDFDIDVDAVVARMKDEGISDETIANSRIVLRATPDNPSERMKTYGDYVRREKRISIYADAHVQADIYQELTEGYASGSEDAGGDYDKSYAFMKSIGDSAGSREMTKVLYHEIRHMRQDDIGQKSNEKQLGLALNFKGYFLRYVPSVAIAQGGHEALDAMSSYDTNIVSTIAVLGLAAVVGTKSASNYVNKNHYKDVYRKDQLEIDAREAENEVPDGYDNLPITIKARYI